MKIKLLTVGKPDNRHYWALCEQYARRISHYTSLDITAVHPEKIASLSPAEILLKEGQRILAKLEPADFAIAMDKGGKVFTSEGFAEFFNKSALSRTKRLTFIIGGPIGLSEQVLEKAQMSMSLSTMTLAHELATVVLLEQIYRAFTILRGEKYHK